MLSLASSIAQLVDFGRKIVCQTKEITQAGYLSHVTEDLSKITTSLQQQVAKNETHLTAPTAEEQVCNSLIHRPALHRFS